MDAWAAQAPPGCDGLVCEPTFYGERGRGELAGSLRGITALNLSPGHLCRADTLPGAPQPREDHPDESHLERRLLEEFRLISSNLRPDTAAAIQTFSRLAKVPRYRIIGADPDEPAESQPLDAEDK